jgi:hypothetical protein
MKDGEPIDGFEALRDFIEFVLTSLTPTTAA